MRRSRTQFQLIALAFMLAMTSVTWGQDNNAASQPQVASNTTQTRTVAEGQHLKIEGIVTKRNADTFTMRESDGTETAVVLTDKTSVKTVRKGLFRRDKTSGVSYILRGLRLKAEG